MNKFDILDSIIQETGDMIDNRLEIEHLLENLDYIYDYAVSMDVPLDNDECMTIRDVGLEWVGKVNNGGEWSLYREQAESELSS